MGPLWMANEKASDGKHAINWLPRFGAPVFFSRWRQQRQPLGPWLLSIWDFVDRGFELRPQD